MTAGDDKLLAPFPMGKCPSFVDLLRGKSSSYKPVPELARGAGENDNVLETSVLVLWYRTMVVKELYCYLWWCSFLYGRATLVVVPC
jgi:hypothetical protein